MLPTNLTRVVPWPPRAALAAAAVVAVVVVAVVPARARAAPGVGYATSPGYYQKDTRPTLYQPLNLLDGRELTAWCSRGSDAQEDPLRFGLRGPATIDEIRVYTGNGTDDHSFQAFSRAKKLSLKSPTRATTFTVADQRGLQSIPLNPPLQGEQFTLEILDQYAADDPQSPVCLTDVVFYSEGKPLNGNWLAPKLKYDRARAQVLGTWYAGFKGAPERYLSFFFDGTYRFLFDPFEKKRGLTERSFSGEYSIRGGTVVLRLPGKARAVGKLALPGDGTPATPGAAPAARSLTFGGKNVPDDFRQPFRDQG